MESSSSSGSKRRRLMVSYVSLRSDLPATFESLNDDTLTSVLEFVGNKCYRSFGGVNKHCKEIYLETKGMTKETFIFGYAPLSVIINKIEKGGRIFNLQLHKALGKGVVFYNRMDVMDWLIEEKKKDVKDALYIICEERMKSVLKGICDVAAEEGRTDLLNEVWNNVSDENDKREIFLGVDSGAARHGKLNVLKWVETKGLSINKEDCAEGAARGGHLHILKWLKEEKGLELNGDLYYHSIDGDQLHVIKWLKEQEVDWTEFTFPCAAQEGNSEILQWLHDKSCPWPEDEYVDKEDLEPEVIEWLRANGYGDRIQI